MTGRRFFRALLRVLPFDFRADYGREIEQTFREQHREAPGRAAPRSFSRTGSGASASEGIPGSSAVR